MKRTAFFLSAAVAVALTAFAHTAAAGDTDGYVRFENGFDEKIEVRIIHTDGSLQKKEQIKPKDGNGFKFSGCEDKNRKFEIRLASSGTVVGSGAFQFDGTVNSGFFTSDCDLKLDQPTFDTPAAAFSLSFQRISRKRGLFTAFPAGGN